jgi:hypothetical protein
MESDDRVADLFVTIFVFRPHPHMHSPEGFGPIAASRLSSIRGTLWSVVSATGTCSVGREWADANRLHEHYYQ